MSRHDLLRPTQPEMSQHFFDTGIAAGYRYQVHDSITFPDLLEGKEIRTILGYDKRTDFAYDSRTLKVCQENTRWLSAQEETAKVILFDRDADGVTFLGADKRFSNQTDVYEYGIGAAPAIAYGQFGRAGCPGAAPAGYARWTHTSYEQTDGYVKTYPATLIVDETQPREIDKYKLTTETVFLRHLPASKTVYAMSGSASSMELQESYEYDCCSLQNRSGTTQLETYAATRLRGNLTGVTRWLRHPSGAPGPSTVKVLSRGYDTLGNIVSETAGQTTTGYEYSALYHGAWLTTVTMQKGNTQDALSQQTQFEYDLSSGRLVSRTDSNGLVSRAEYADSLDRLTKVTVGVGTAAPQTTAYAYSDAPGNLYVETTRDQYNINDRRVSSTTWYDSFRRPIKTESGYRIRTVQPYDGLGRVVLSTNPTEADITDVTAHCNSTNACTKTVYDGMGRVTAVHHPGGAVTSTAYSGHTTTVTDPAGREQTTTTDGLGRLVEVKENDGSTTLPTIYAYNALDNLTGVTQGGQARTFLYDSWGRLRSATNPENKTVEYDYDVNSNLIRRTANPLTPEESSISYEYDLRNRLVKKTYAGARTAPTAYQCWDGKQIGSNGCTGTVTGSSLGLLTGVGNASSWTMRSYDEFGRVTQNTQTMAAPTPTSYTTGYSYYLDGTMARTTYPSQRQTTQCYDEWGRVTWIAPGAKESTCQTQGAVPADANAKVVSYWPHGSAEQLMYGNGKVEQMCFNTRLQATSVKVFSGGASACASNGAQSDADLMNLHYDYGTTANNGNVLSQRIAWPGTSPGILKRKQIYTYDGMNRLENVSETADAGSTWPASGTDGDWTIRYRYDRYGNQRIDPSLTTIALDLATPKDETHIDVATNRVTKVQVGSDVRDVTYDLAGNLKYHPLMGTFTYDGEGLLVSASRSGATTTYEYDGEGRRVKKVWSGTATTYVYGADGKLMAEYGGTADTGLVYLTADPLGSTRMVTRAGAGEAAVVSRQDYFPFGGEISGSASNGQRQNAGAYGSSTSITQKFTGKERDQETGLDYFGARYFSGAQGRFASPDRPFADQQEGNPQSWNLYSYVRNNPLRFIDPTGRECVTLDNGTVGDDGQGNKCTKKEGQFGTGGNFTVGVGGDEARLIMLSMVGDRLSSRHQWSTVASGGIKGATALWGIKSAAQGGWRLFSGLTSVSETIPGLYGGVSRAALEAAARNGGETVKVVTNLTQAPAVGRGLSVAVGEGAEMLAGTARTGTTYVAHLPRSLVDLMKGAGLATESTTQMGGAVATELRFTPQAAEFVAPFFKVIQ